MLQPNKYGLLKKGKGRGAAERQYFDSADHMMAAAGVKKAQG